MVASVPRRLSRLSAFYPGVDRRVTPVCAAIGRKYVWSDPTFADSLFFGPMLH